ncbi:putative DCC family thiol-disulfide oxidoreductase YuxK [Peribacillus deserti]|uniref:DCC family thiol-disulfide oxidoreductase YuxK n=1 Tax=Peribacillus deserti TaxID=673318 RepID=A0ABS2QDT2_9BACI|nr:thiol-disulfide oxidoreductase DCC family protein [Peribacillus deserti]MBM7691185.1 putative DCC family thiol-disulfide oxidoreductase YuxK [Peribacillus deserti]
MHNNHSIILFDGVCNLCNSAVQFIVKRDKQGHFSFASLQSDIGRQLIEKFHVAEEIDSIILLENNRAYIYSDAALRIASSLEGGFRAAKVLLIIPRPVRDFFYKIIARNRYKWFGRRNECMLPTKELKSRFLVNGTIKE